MTLLSQRREVGEFRKRYKWMALVVVLIFLALLGRVTYLQTVQYGKYSRIAQDNITKTVGRPATRGELHDTRGRIIASNRPSWNIFVTPRLLDEEIVERIIERLALSEDEQIRFKKRLASIPPRRQSHQILMFKDVTRDQMATVKENRSDLPGLDVYSVPVRAYPYGSLGAHSVGYLNEVTAEDLERLEGQGYRAGDVLGRMGVERAWQSYLRGRRGFERVTVDVAGRRLVTQPVAANEEDSERRSRDPVPGRDIVLTLDMELMRSIRRAFRGHPSGAAVVMDVNTGRIRALFSKPSYDLNEMSGRLTTARYRELRENPFRPLIDKTVYESYYPGSTFKPISALAALGDSILDPRNVVDCIGYYELGGRKFKCTKIHGDVNMRSAMVQSCNTYFYKLAEQVGLNRLKRYANMYGLGTPAGVGINTEASGFFPSREWYLRRYDNRFRVGFTLNNSIGQGNTRTTLVQLAALYSAMANGGTLYVPQLVERVSAPSGDLIEEFPPRVRRQVTVEPEHMRLITESLFEVVNTERGTAWDARVADGVQMSGKTGTAQVPKRRAREGDDPRRYWYFNRAHAWFAGWAPAENPELAIVVLVEHGGAGGKAAAPIATRVIAQHFEREASTAASAEGSP